MNSILVRGAGFRVALTRKIGHRLVRPRPGDAYLVAHPRSGSTWLRTVLTNLVEPTADSSPDVFNARIPGVSVRKAIQVASLPSPRTLMTHGDYLPSLRKVVYLVRDGRDAIVSYYHYRVTRRGQNLPFAQFLSWYLRGYYGHLWHRNVESWLGWGVPALGNNMMVLRFEDMRHSTPEAVARVAAFLGFPCEAAAVAAAIERSRLQRMKEIERERRGALGDVNRSFYRSGGSGEWRDYFSPEGMDMFERLSGKAMVMAGYSGDRGGTGS